MLCRQSIIVSALAGLLLASASGDEPIPLPDDAPRDYHAKYAVIVGINDYQSHGQGLCDLHYAANDAREFRKLLVEDFGYDDARILYLTDAKDEPKGVVDGTPTVAAIRDAFEKWLPTRGLGRTTRHCSSSPDTACATAPRVPATSPRPTHGQPTGSIRASL